MLRFRLFGIPYEIGVQFWIFTALLGSTLLNTPNGPLKLVLWVVCALLSIVVHELGHAVVGRRFGAQSYVLLYGLGGLTYLPGAYLTRGRSILVSLAGPAMGFALWLVVRALAGFLLGGSVLDGVGDTAYLVISTAIKFLIYMNLYWTILNLLPILPLDGGQVLRDVLGPTQLTTARIIGAVFAAVVCVLAALGGQIFLAIFFGALAYSNFTGDTRSFTGGVQRG